MKTVLCLLALLMSSVSYSSAEEPLWVAKPLTAEHSFTSGVEGPACDREGNLYAVNFAKQQTIGKVYPDGKAEIFVTLPNKSTGNGIRFNKAGLMYVADYVGHNVLLINPVNKKVKVFAHEPKMNQPNDLAMAPDGSLFASDPDWKNNTGKLWRISKDAKVSLIAEGMGTTNGIDFSPKGDVLYVNESIQRNVWAFDVKPDGTVSNKRLIKQFPDFGFDGMRTDVEGNLYITRHGKGTVIKMNTQGEVLQEVDVLGKSPTNLCFGGADGRTVYVTEAEKCRVVTFRADKPGRERSFKPTPPKVPAPAAAAATPPKQAQ